jgi:catechol 2,3-dioxygenase-like lactoylglutathione lyase family enzyme
MRFRAQGLDHVALTVGDQQTSERRNRDGLGLAREQAAEWGDTPVALMAHGSGVALFKKAPDNQRAVGLRHIAFRVDRENFELAHEDLRHGGIAFESKTTASRTPSTSTIPTVLQLELTTYEI